MSLWAAIPLRGFASGKSRLAPLLDAGERSRLNRQLYARTVDCAVETLGAGRVMIVSPDDEVIRAASRQGLVAVAEPEEAGLNGALDLARRAAAARGAQALLSLSADLPLLETADLAALCQAWDGDESMLLAADEAGTGTNALVLPIQAGVPYAMGPGSASRHRDAARLAGLRLREIRRPGLAFDLDLPEDLLRWRRLAEAAA